MKDLKKITLKNGLRVLFVPRPEDLAATALILVEAGSEYETKKINGVSHFLEHLMFKGTASRPKPGMIAHELASLGAQSNAFTDHEYTGYWAKVRAEKLPDILEIVSDLYLNPLFERAEIEKERGVIIQEINMYEDDLPAKAQQLLDALVYGDQPAGWDVGGEKKVIRRLGRDDFVGYRAARYVAQGTVVVVAGKFNEKAALAQIKEYFGSLPRRRVIAKKRTVERQSAPRVKVHFKKTDQAHLAIAFRAFDMFDPRRYALRVLADILGGGMSSRLFMRVREEMGAAYYVGAGADLALDHGTLGISAGVDHLKIDAVIGAVLEECRRLSAGPVPEKELQKSKDHMLGNLVLGLETSDDMASFYGGQEIFGREILSPEAYADRIKGVTAEQVLAVARAVLRDKGLNIAIVGPYRTEKRFTKEATLK
ncbi:MAG: pitrilysin family protein [Candidatus Pacebacteria bacterium]|nr:pitrilysin family protein [Candidatus Paceibacterota bacterium]